MSGGDFQPGILADMTEEAVELAADQLIIQNEDFAKERAAGQLSAAETIDLQCGATRLSLCPARGGGILNFTWGEIDIFRPFKTGALPIDLASFPLVPFCNRVANRRIQDGRNAHLLPAPPKEIDAQHALHGLGWTSAWSAKLIDPRSAQLSLDHDGSQWPWAFAADQTIKLNRDGYSQRLSLTNEDAKPMPAGLGFHPYFPREGAKLRTGVTGFWDASADHLPTKHVALDSEPNWFGGDFFDHCFTGGTVSLQIDWPTHRLRIHTSANLPFSHIFVPKDADFFCVEPVSHIPDAVNSPLGATETGLIILEPGESMEVECRFQVEAID